MKIIAPMFLLSLISLNVLAEDNFSGSYAGIQLGYTNTKDEGAEYGPTGITTGWIVNTKPKGAVYGLNAGVNKVLENKLLIGVEAGIEGKDVNGKQGGNGQGLTPNTWPMKTEFTSGYSVKAKVGYVFNDDSTIVYGTGGMAMSHIKSSLYDSPGITVVDHQSNDETGWLLGLGLEHFFCKNISAKAEYEHADYGKLNVKATNYTSPGSYEHQNITENSFRIGLNYHF